MSSFHASAWRCAYASVATFALISLAACNTTSDSGATSFAPTPPKPGFAALYVGRPGGSNVSFFPVPVELDGRPLASLGFGTYTRVEVPPGQHTVAVPESGWTRAINGRPHPVTLTADAGKSYFLLPTRWAENPGYRYQVVGTTVAPIRTAEGHSSFSVQTMSAGGVAPMEFSGLAYTAPEQ